MSYTQQARDLPIETIQDILQRQGSVQAVVHHITGGKVNESVRAIIARRIKEVSLTGVRRQNISTRYTTAQLASALSTAECWSDVYRSLGLSVCDHNKAGIIRFATHHGMDEPTFSDEQIKNAFRRGKHTWTDVEVFCENSTFARSGLRDKALKSNILGYYVCSKCGLGDMWQEEELRLELDHINGCHTDNRVENLRWLCPNCHTQTDTHKGRNRK